MRYVGHHHHHLAAPSADHLSVFNAVVTAIGVGAAMVAGFFAFQAYRRERARDDARENQAISDQASRVAAWAVTNPSSDAVGIPNPDVKLDYEWYACVRNASDLPVYRVVVLWHGGGERALGSGHSLDVLPPSSEPLRLPNAASALHDWLDTYEGAGGTRGVAPADHIGVAMWFTDANDREWQRTQKGVLVPVVHEPSHQPSSWWQFWRT